MTERYIELHSSSAFSFLKGASQPEELIKRAVELEMPAIALLDRNGGMVICQGQLNCVVPLERASMPGRTVVQWDKEDCADLGIIKVDLLGLGMMAVLKDCIELIPRHYGESVDLAQLPEDEDVYKVLQQADTVGMFQVESRAQMASLPRNCPTRFYDLVVQVAIIRPGPIVGKMMHPYMRRRHKKEAVTYPHPSLEPVLKRTLGVPLFQEQLLRIAMTVANFSGAEAEELRRAVGMRRSWERMKNLEGKLRAGMTTNGLNAATQENIIQNISSFALYGLAPQPDRIGSRPHASRKPSIEDCRRSFGGRPRSCY
jgi:error-prone DNA polymerase